MDFSFRYKNRNFRMDVKECRSILSQARGLIFKEKSKPLFFIFKNKKRRAIHSFFCLSFVAIWFNGNRIIEVKLIKPWKISVKPKEKFDKLLEIPSSDKNFKEFLDDFRNI